MIFAQSATALEEHLRVHGIHLDHSPPLDICRACLGFYTAVRADGILPMEEDGDMFLFQWGRSEYSKRPEEFGIDMVRQFAPGDAAQEDPEVEYFQLHCTIWMPAAPFASIENGHLWLPRPEEAPRFLADLERHPVLLQARNQRQTASEIALERV